MKELTPMGFFISQSEGQVAIFIDPEDSDYINCKQGNDVVVFNRAGFDEVVRVFQALMEVQEG